MREEFEKLPEIATHLAHGNVFYSEEKSAYASEFSALHFVACYVNGAWMAWQEQQKRIDELQLKASEDSRILHNVIEIETKKNAELQNRIDELKHEKSLQELEINQISQANQEWQRINVDLKKQIDTVEKLPSFWRDFINGFPHISEDSKVQLIQCADELEQALKGGDE